MVGATGRVQSENAKAKDQATWLGSTPQIHVPILPPWQRCSCAVLLARHAAQVDSGKSPEPTPTCVRVPAGEAGAVSARARSRSIFKSRHSWALRNNAAQMAILKDNDVASRPPLTSKRCVAAAASQRKELREVMQTNAQRKPCPRPTAWDSHAEKRGRVKAEAQAATPRHKP